MKPGYNNAIGPQVRENTKPPRSKAKPIVAGVSMLAGLSGATQYFAHQFHYHATLGPNVNHLYAPWSILGWAKHWNTLYPDQFMQAASVGVVVSGIGLLGLTGYSMIAANSSKPNIYLHGSARWAERKDIEAAGLLPRTPSFGDRLLGRLTPAHDGVYVGAWVDKKGRQHYLRHNGPEHVLTYAPTRSGKGVGLVIPTLLSWAQSCVITDLKGELWAITAGWRQKYAKNKTIRFEPATSNGSAAWNPLAEIRVGTEAEVGDVQNLATLMVDPDGKGLESHWQKTSQALLVGLILHVIYKGRNEGFEPTLPMCDHMLSDPDRAIGELWMEMTTYGHVNGNVHPVVAAAARDMMDRPEEEAGSVLSTAKSYLSLYRDPVVARNVSRSDFRIKDLMHHDDPVSLYIVTQPNDKERLRPLVRVLVNMIVRLLADKMEFENGRAKATYKHRLLMMLDEFPSLGKLNILQESLAFVAGYGIKCYLICQDINQLKSREMGYGPDETITSNCHVQNAYPPGRTETAEHLSKLTGQTTVVKEQITTSGKRMSGVLQQVSRTTQETQRPLLTPDECLRMPGPKKGIRDGKDVIEEAGDMVVYVAGYPAIYGKQPLYFNDETFLARAQVPPPARSDRIVRAGTASNDAAAVAA
ncbi:type IV secretory system conjugative DNA transfer family protein [Burkholderia aenigmatica]|uniref:type IV secretory system conjugative DNA transfer family protein n=1 Tax=Burkholderia aenigmatica TaxID=2015348 RepID=UPI00264A8808|nr:type IV secretory system conjugative DNA transfer family protein [Burkholderia aenigmatica]MDN7880066.1 type IV secretory system conjugative DNA transfer family protein [Burkholderia aenigmatica]